MDSVLSQAEERYERHYALKRQGYDLNRVAERVAEIYGMEAREIMSGSKQPTLLLGCQGVGHVDETTGEEVGNDSPWNGLFGRVEIPLSGNVSNLSGGNYI